MIAMIAGDSDMMSGPIPVALAYAGYTTRAALTTDEARQRLDRHGADRCVLVVDAGLLDTRAGSDTWSGFLTRHRGLPAVFVARGPERPAAGALTGAAHRLLVDDPFDATAVVTAVRRVSARSRAPVAVVLPRRISHAS